MKQMKQTHGNAAQQHEFALAGTAGNDGECPLVLAKAPVYTDEQVASLLYMIEEEKMAGDLYEQSFEQMGWPIFDKIADAEDHHMDALLDQALLAGIDVSGVISLPAGEFLNTDLQDLYTGLLETGSASIDAALAVGQLIEQTDIADLEGAIVGVVGTPLENTYSHLLTGSEQHLAAFDFWLG